MFLLLAAVAAPLLLSGCGRGLDAEQLRRFQAAQAAFDKASRPEDFQRVAAMYQEMLDAGLDSGAVLYNQGNAYVRAKQTGRAIAAYRHAQRYRPRDQALEANLGYVLRGETPAAGRRPLVETLLFWQNSLSYAEKFYVVATTAGAAFLLALAALIWRRRLWKRLMLAVLVLTAMASFSAAYDWYRYQYTVHGVIVQPKVVARKGNANSYEPAFTEALSEGAEFRLIERRGDWLLVQLPGDEEGWVQEDAAALY